MTDQLPTIGAETAAGAELSPSDLLAAIAGLPSPQVAGRVRAVLEHAAQEAVYEDGPVAVDDPVLTLEFQHTFTRRQVVQLLAELRRNEIE